MYPASAADVNRRGHELSRKSRRDSSSRDHCRLLRRFAGDGCFAALLATGKKRAADRRYPAPWSGMGEQSSGMDATGWCRKGKFQHAPSVVHAHCWLNWYLLSQERIGRRKRASGKLHPSTAKTEGVCPGTRERESYAGKAGKKRRRPRKNGTASRAEGGMIESGWKDLVGLLGGEANPKGNGQSGRSRKS